MKWLIKKHRYFVVVADHDLWVLAIGKNPSVHVSLRPNMKYVGNMHGNEVSLPRKFTF